MSSSPALDQRHFRFRTDASTVDTTATWAAGEDVNWSVAVETNFRLRFAVFNNGAAAGAGPYILRVSKNSGTYTAVTTSTGATLGAQSADAGASADEAVIGSFQGLTTSSGGVSGVYDETGSATKSLGVLAYTEFEYGLILKTAGATAGDTFDFRIYNSTTAFTTYTQTPRVTALPQAINQAHFRIRTDTAGVNAAPTWAAAEDTSINLAVETTFRIRFCVENTSAASADGPIILRVSKNAGAYTAVTTTSGATLGAQSNDSSSDADAAIISITRLTAGAGTSASGRYDETGSISASISAAQYQEFECGLILKTAGAADGDTFDFRLYNSTVAFATYTQTPRITAGSGVPNNACLANDVLSASSVTQPAVQQVHNPLANDVKSNSSVSQPAAIIRRDLLANDVTSASSVSTPTATQIVPPVAALANDVLSASSVSNPSVQQRQALLANDVLSASSVGQPAVKQLQGLAANDVLSASSVTKPTQLRQLQALLANDVASPSSVSQPTAGQIIGATALLANDVISASSVTQPAAVIGRAILANDVASASSVTQPGAFIRRDVLANDIVSASSVSQPTAIIGRTLLANDVLSASSVTLPAAGIQRVILANDVTSASKVSNPIVGIVGVVQGRDVISASSVTQPALKSLHGLLANDVLSVSSVTTPVTHQTQVLDAVNVTSASSVTTPLAGEIAAGQPLANDIVSASFVSTPTLAVEGGEVIPVPPEVGGGGKIYGRGFPRKRWEELLRLLEVERRAALQRANAFPSNKDRQKARKAARAASEAIAAALAAADEAAEVAHAGAITRSLEAAAEAKGIAEYLAQMKAAREAAIEMELDDDDEAVLMMVA